MPRGTTLQSSQRRQVEISLWGIWDGDDANLCDDKQVERCRPCTAGVCEVRLQVVILLGVKSCCVGEHFVNAYALAHHCLCCTALPLSYQHILHSICARSSKARIYHSCSAPTNLAFIPPGVLGWTCPPHSEEASAHQQSWRVK
jgi:hypothetical protein